MIKKRNNDEEPIYMVQIEQIDEESMMKVDMFSMRVDVGDICLDPTLDSNNRFIVSNNKTLKGKVKNQGVQKLMVMTCHDDVCEQSFSLTSFNFHCFQLIEMTKESFIEKLRRIVRKKKVRKNLVCERKRELKHQEEVVAKG